MCFFVELWLQTPYSQKLDVFSLGVVFVELLAMEVLDGSATTFVARTSPARDLLPEISARYSKPLVALISDMLSDAEAERPSAAQCVSVLRKFAGVVPVVRPSSISISTDGDAKDDVVKSLASEQGAVAMLSSSFSSRRAKLQQVSAALSTYPSSAAVAVAACAAIGRVSDKGGSMFMEELRVFDVLAAIARKFVSDADVRTAFTAVVRRVAKSSSKVALAMSQSAVLAELLACAFDDHLSLSAVALNALHPLLLANPDILSNRIPHKGDQTVLSQLLILLQTPDRKPALNVFCISLLDVSLPKVAQLAQVLGLYPLPPADADEPAGDTPISPFTPAALEQYGLQRLTEVVFAVVKTACADHKGVCLKIKDSISQDLKSLLAVPELFLLLTLVCHLDKPSCEHLLQQNIVSLLDDTLEKDFWPPYTSTFAAVGLVHALAAVDPSVPKSISFMIPYSPFPRRNISNDSVEAQLADIQVSRAELEGATNQTASLMAFVFAAKFASLDKSKQGVLTADMLDKLLMLELLCARNYDRL